LEPARRKRAQGRGYLHPTPPLDHFSPGRLLPDGEYTKGSITLSLVLGLQNETAKERNDHCSGEGSRNETMGIHELVARD
jgi:hypothetical protein